MLYSGWYLKRRIDSNNYTKHLCLAEWRKITHIDLDRFQFRLYLAFSM